MFLFYNSGLAIWGFFSGCFSSSPGPLPPMPEYLVKCIFPACYAVASIVSSLIKFGIQFLLLLTVYFYFLFKGFHPVVGWGLLFIPMSLILAAGIGFGMGIIVSSVTTKYRDLNMFTGYVIQLLMYATPIIYAYSKAPATSTLILI